MARYVKLDSQKRFEGLVEIDPDNFPESLDVNDYVLYNEDKIEGFNYFFMTGGLDDKWKWDQENEKFFIEDDDLSGKIKEWRNRSLVNSDWTQNPDFPESFRTEWQTYRQKLRDLPDDENFPRLSATSIKPEDAPHANPFGQSHLSANT